MYSSSSSSSQHSAPPNNSLNLTTHHNLMRYGSAPSSFLDSAVESVVGLSHHHHHGHQQSRFSGHESTHLNESTNNHNQKSTLTLLRPSYGSGLNNNNVAMDESHSHSQSNNSSSSNLIRHSSSPAGFLHHLTSDTAGFSVSKGLDNYSSQGGSTSGHKLSRLGSQLSFTKHDQRSLSQISEVNECVRSGPSQSHSPSGFSLSAWDDGSNSYVFSSSSAKRSKVIEDDILNGLAAIDSQAVLEMASMERLLHIPQDSVPCKIRAKRGCATHPRSIAERERRTRISGKLKKLQELVPNMDKQTSYADMLDLAVQHIKGLQNQIQKLHNELDNCTCGCKQSMQH